MTLLNPLKYRTQFKDKRVLTPTLTDVRFQLVIAMLNVDKKLYNRLRLYFS